VNYPFGGNPIIHTLVNLRINQHTTSEVPSFTYSMSHFWDVTDLRQHLTDIWNSFPQSTVDNAIDA